MIIASELASSAVRFLERMEGRAVAPAALARVKLSPEQVRRMAIAAAPLTPEQTRLALAKHTRAAKRGGWGRGGLPEHVVRAMYAEYQKGASCTGVAKIFGGTRQSIFEVFKSHGLALRERKPAPTICYRGQTFSRMHDGYFRLRLPKQPSVLLQRKIWEDAHGPIPPGWQVFFHDGDRMNIAIDNLRCLPIGEVIRDQPRREKLRKTKAAA